MTIDLNLLALLFFLVASLYSLAGFGGGSSYVALLILFGVSYKIAPTLALSCNLIVVTMGSIGFYRTRQINLRLAVPFILTSIPFAYLGGSFVISKNLFQVILAVCLLIAGIKMIFYRKNINYNDFKDNPPFLISVIVGAILGLISGIAGIGGGIFLAPILYVLRWGNPRYIASTSSLFILVNSVAGLLGHYQKHSDLIDYSLYLPLLLAVALGGQVGSYLTNNKLSLRKIELSTSFLVLLVASRLFWNVLL